jgi:hypothetical protein
MQSAVMSIQVQNLPIHDTYIDDDQITSMGSALMTITGNDATDMKNLIRWRKLYSDCESILSIQFQKMSEFDELVLEMDQVAMKHFEHAAHVILKEAVEEKGAYINEGMRDMKNFMEDRKISLESASKYKQVFSIMIAVSLVTYLLFVQLHSELDIVNSETTSLSNRLALINSNTTDNEIILSSFEERISEIKCNFSSLRSKSSSSPQISSTSSFLFANPSAIFDSSYKQNHAFFIERCEESYQKIMALDECIHDTKVKLKADLVENLLVDTDQMLRTLQEWANIRSNQVNDILANTPHPSLLTESIVLIDEESIVHQDICSNLHEAIRIQAVTSLEVGQKELLIPEDFDKDFEMWARYSSLVENVKKLCCILESQIEDTKR